MHKKLNSFSLDISHALLKVFLIMFVCLKHGGRDCVCNPGHLHWQAEVT